ALQLRAGSYLLSILDRLEVVQWLQFRAKSQVAHQVLSGAGKILFRREIIFGALPLWMRTPAPSLAKMERLCRRRMAETAGQFKPVAQHKLCGLFPSQMQITELLSAKKALSLEQQMAATHGRPKQTPERCVFSKFRLPMAIRDRRRRWRRDSQNDQWR